MVASKRYQDPNMSYVRINTNSCVNKKPGDDDSSIRGYITTDLSARDKNVITAQLLHKSLREQTPPQTPRTEKHGETTSVVEQTRLRVKVSIKTEKGSKRGTNEEPTASNNVKVRKTLNTNGTVKRIQVTVGSCSSTGINDNLALQNSQLREQNKALEEQNRELEGKVNTYLNILKCPAKLSSLRQFLLERPQQP